MSLLLLEALLALVILIAIVWWTMFSGRHKGELRASDTLPPEDNAPKLPADTRESQNTERP